MKLPRIQGLELGLGLGCLLFIGAAGQEASVDEPGLGAGLVRVAELCGAEQFEDARARGEELLAPNAFAAWRRELEQEGSRFVAPTLDLADAALDLFRLNGWTRQERAHVHFALGVVELAAQESDAAKREFDVARTRAGRGELRRDAAYNLGTVALLQAEAWRAQIPELGGQPPQATQSPTPAAPGMPPAAPEEPPDPLEQARLGYLEAREHFIARLRMDWRQEDPRANTELVMRRLRGLDEIERQREEQQQQQQEQQENQNQEPQENQDQDPEGEDQEQNSEQEQESDPGQEEQQEQEQDEAGQEEQQEEPEQAEEESNQEPQQEIFLTKEEVQRLLDRLKRHEEQGEEIRARRKSQRHRPTPRDW